MHDLDKNGYDELLIYRLSVRNDGKSKLSTHIFKQDFVGPVNNEINPDISGYFLEQNYPNPFNPLTKISYSLPRKTFVSLKVIDVLGNEVAVLDEGEKSEGRYTVQWNGKDKVVFIQRDPRDVAVSASHYLNIPLWDVLRNMCIESDAPFDKSRHIFHVQGAYFDFANGWLRCNGTTYTSYEWLSTGPGELYDILYQLDFTGINLDDLETPYQKVSFDNLKSKHPHSMRKGNVGDWKNHFDQKHGEFITEHLGELMRTDRIRAERRNTAVYYVAVSNDENADPFSADQ